MLQRDKHDVDMIQVEPYSYRSNSEKLLSLLKPTIDTENNINSNTTYHSFKLPIFQGMDITKIIEENNSKLQHSSEKILSYTTDEITDHNESDINSTETGVVSKFVKLESFIPKNLQEQITTIIIKGFPNFKKLVIERLLQKLIADQNFIWTMIDQDFVDNKTVFVRFKNLNLVNWFLDNYKQNISSILGFSSVEIFSDNKLSEYKDKVQVDDKLNELDRIKLESDIRRILSNESNNKSSENAGTEDLDEVLNYYSNYKIDDNELIDVPTNMKEIIVKDIIKFRSKVLTIEKQRRKNEIDLERKKTGQRLKQIFEGKTTDTDSNMEESISSLSLPVIDEFNYMNDEEYNNYLREKQNEELEKRLLKKLQDHVSKENSERGKLLQKLKDLQNYEADLMDNKLDYIEEIKNNHGKNTLYYSDHGEYLQRRNIKRAEEEKNDAIDMEANDEIEDQNIDLGNDKGVNVNESLKIDESGDNNVSEIIISTLNETIINSIRTKISNLIEEYLGINDDFLVNMIFDFLMKNNLSKKEELINELSEPLDDDAEILVNDLWTFISSNS